ncbi:MAG: T9SS type A sorting domain-containing protein [candidate division Zixibacteria bacterium]|nr:T9SS type A sorting domain-containing protein [candidate division Zixibacteria bacterium]
MRKYVFQVVMIILLVFPVIAFCQVDTLRMVEISNIEVPGEITEIYIESIFNSNKEIFICTDDEIHVFDSQTNNPIWSLDGLTNPRDLLFDDINNDGFTDLAFRDEYNIRIYDIVNDIHIWSSPTLDSTYKCYTIGDRNDDDWIDVVYATKEPYTRPGIEGNLDTAWVNVYDGPGFETGSGFHLLMQNSNYSYDRFRESPHKILVDRITVNEGLQNTIILFSDYYYGWFAEGDYSGQVFSGNAWLINGMNFQYNYVSNVCSLLYHETISENDSSLIYFLSDRYSISGSAWGNGHECIKYIKSFSADTVITDNRIWQESRWGSYYLHRIFDWKGFVIDEFNLVNPGNEIIFANDNRIYQFSYIDTDTLWITDLETEIDSLEFAINSPNLYDHQQIICKITEPALEYALFTCFNGLLTARIPNPENEITSVSDFSGDNTEEILSIDGNTLRIYHLDYVSDIDQPATIPHHTFLQPNYPNPFNAVTTIEYGIKQPGHVAIDIYNLLGRHIETLVDTDKPAGQHQVTWHADDYSSGVYFYKLQAGDYIETRSMLLLK